MPFDCDPLRNGLYVYVPLRGHSHHIRSSPANYYSLTLIHSTSKSLLPDQHRTNCLCHYSLSYILSATNSRSSLALVLLHHLPWAELWRRSFSEAQGTPPDHAAPKRSSRSPGGGYSIPHGEPQPTFSKESPFTRISPR